MDLDQQENKFEIGQEVKDSVTGFKGIITAFLKIDIEAAEAAGVPIPEETTVVEIKKEDGNRFITNKASLLPIEILLIED